MSVNAAASSSKQKKDKKEKHTHNANKDKSKKEKKQKKLQKETKEKHDKSPFEHRVSRMRISVAPKFAGDVMAGVREQLDGMIMRFVPQMAGVLLAHWDHSFEDDTAKIVNESPFEIVDVEFHSILWAPKVGQKLFGTHSLSSPSHLSLIFSKTFNVSIPLQHIPTDFYEFEHTDEQAPDEDSDDEDDDIMFLGSSAHPPVEQVGRWKEKESGKALSSGEKIKFTVIGMQVTNQMLSLTGSLLRDPFNPPPAPEPVIPSPRPSPEPSPSPEPAARPQKKARVQIQKTQAQKAADVQDEVDTSQMSARELKVHKKALEKKKRDERKARKAGAANEAGDDLDEDEVHIEELEGGTGTKRKANGVDGEQNKKRKKDD